MKKILILWFIVSVVIGCNVPGVVSENTVKRALDIVYEETKDLDLNDMYRGTQFLFAKDFLSNQEYHKRMKCMVLDASDFYGKKSVRGCIFPNGHPDEKATFGSNDILVEAVASESNKDIISLTFFSNAKKTEKGVSYSTLFPVNVAVNLQTRKIGKI